MDDAALVHLSKSGQLYLSLAEMQAIQRPLRRRSAATRPTASSRRWPRPGASTARTRRSRGRIEFEGEIIDNLLKQTIFKATRDLDLDWLVSVFADNAGVVRFDDEYDVCFKVETHNHPSAIDPYGGANTGLGGVIRDPLGTGLGAKPICNTDVFCVAPPDLPPDALPAGRAPSPARAQGGRRRACATTATGWASRPSTAPWSVDPGYLANPLVFCGTVGVLPRGMSEKHVEPGDRIVAIGGRTGRDGIHGATFSSAELTGESETVSGGAVQIGNAITEKMVLDVDPPGPRPRPLPLDHRLRRRRASARPSARWASDLGAEVDLDRAPLKYEGLSYTEIWISEAQERMVLAVPPEHWPELEALCAREQVEATDLGQFVATGPADAALSRRDGRRPVDGLPPRRPARRSSGRRRSRRRPSGRSPLPDRARLHRRPARAPAAPGTSAARSGSSASTTTRSRRGRSSSRWSGVATTGRATPRSSCRCAARRGAWRSPAGSTRATAGSTPTRWPAA